MPPLEQPVMRMLLFRGDIAKVLDLRPRQWCLVVTYGGCVRASRHLLVGVEDIKGNNREQNVYCLPSGNIYMQYRS